MNKKLTASIIALLVLFLSNHFIKPPKQPTLPLSPTPQKNSVLSSTTSATLVKVTKVIDGDTIEIETGQKVRYIGIDTPETATARKKTECFAEEATKKNRELVEGKVVRLEKDISEIDKFGRLLRYVYTEDTPVGLFVNYYLVKEGYAQAVTFPPDVKHAKLFRQAEQEARALNKRLWKECF